MYNPSTLSKIKSTNNAGKASIDIEPLNTTNNVLFFALSSIFSYAFPFVTFLTIRYKSVKASDAITALSNIFPNDFEVLFTSFTLTIAFGYVSFIFKSLLYVLTYKFPFMLLFPEILSVLTSHLKSSSIVPETFKSVDEITTLLFIFPLIFVFLATIITSSPM